MSWDEAFASHYDDWSAHMTADVAFYVSLALQADGPLVELAIGNGRVAITIAQARYGHSARSPFDVRIGRGRWRTPPWDRGRLARCVECSRALGCAGGALLDQPAL